MEVHQNGVSRQDSGMPADEDLGSPIDSSVILKETRRSLVELDNTLIDVESNCTITSESNCTLNSECNITVIHVPPADDSGSDGLVKDDEHGTPIAEADKKDYVVEGKDSKDGSDSGVEGCAVEPPRVSWKFFVSLLFDKQCMYLYDGLAQGRIYLLTTGNELMCQFYRNYNISIDDTIESTRNAI